MLYLSIYLSIFSPIAYAATAEIDPTRTVVLKSAMYNYRGVAVVKDAATGANIYAEAGWTGSPAFDSPLVPCRDSSKNNDIVAFGLHSDGLYMRFNSDFTKQIRVTDSMPFNFNTIQPTRVWESDGDINMANSNMSHWVLGCYTPDNGTNFYAPAHTELYRSHPDATGWVSVTDAVGNPVFTSAGVRIKRYAKVSGAVRVKEVLPKDTNPDYPNLQSSYVTWAKSKSPDRGVWFRPGLRSSPDPAWPRDGQYWGSYDLNLVKFNNGLDHSNNDITRLFTIIKGPALNPSLGLSLQGKWKASDNTSFLCGFNEQGQPVEANKISGMGQWELSNLAEYSEAGVTYVTMFTGIHPKKLMGFPECPLANFYKNKLNSTYASYPEANANSKWTDNVTLDPRLHSYAPFLVRAKKADMATSTAWQVYGYANATATTPSWINICATCTIDGSIPVSSNNIKPYLFFLNNQPTYAADGRELTGCAGTISSCKLYHTQFNASMGQSLRIVNGKLVQFGTDYYGYPYFSWTTSLNDPRQLESTLTRMTFLRDPVTNTYPFNNQDFLMGSARYLSVFDNDSPDRNMLTFKNNGNGIWDGVMVISYRGDGGNQKGTPTQPTIFKYTFRLYGL